MFPTLDGDVQAVSDLSYTLHRGETLGIVGESGSGKSVSSLALMGLLNRERTQIERRGHFGGRNLVALVRAAMRKIRGKDMAMIFQDPFACLHPMYRVGDQIAEAVTAHASVSKSDGDDTRSRDPRRRSASRRPRSAHATIRTSSRAACASAP